MPTKQENDNLYMGIAVQYSKLSKAKRKQVGACLVTEHGVVLGGYNGTPTDCSNECELDVSGFGHYVTKPEVVHAELNAVLKAAREGVSCFNATIYTTLSPCVPCAAMLVNAGIKKLIYSELYRCDAGVQLLKSANVDVEQFNQ